MKISEMIVRVRNLLIIRAQEEKRDGKERLQAQITVLEALLYGGGLKGDTSPYWSELVIAEEQQLPPSDVVVVELWMLEKVIEASLDLLDASFADVEKSHLGDVINTLSGVLEELKGVYSVAVI